jgi:hypothetical protein
MSAMPQSLSRLLAVAAACVIAAALTVILTHVSSAGGAGKISNLTYKSKTVTIPGDDTTHKGTAKCPSGLHVLGGGLKLSDPDPETVEGSFPKKRNSWVGADYRPSGAGGSSHMTVYAICGK